MNKNRENLTLMLISVIGFAILFVIGGGARVDLGDSQGYIQFNSVAPPLYPTFLWIMRLIIGEEWYLQGVAVLQNLLGAFSVWYLTVTVKRHFNLNMIWSVMVFILAYTPHVFTPLLSRTHFVLSNAILSEGISVSLYYIWLAVVIDTILEKSYRKYYLALFISLLIIMTRKQLLFVGVVMVLICIYLWNKHDWKQGVYRIIAMGFCVIIYYGCTFAYLNILSEPVVNLTYDLGRISAVMYNADETDRNHFDDEGTRELFDTLYRHFDENKMSHHYTANSLIADAQHQEDCYDPGGRLAGLLVQEFCQNHGIVTPEEQIIESRRHLSEIQNKLFVHNWRRQMQYSFNYVIQGLVRTISTTNRLLSIFAFIMYALAICLMCYLLKKHSKSARLMFWVFILILGNVCSTALVIMCLSRYMIYNMSIFYIAGLMMLKETIEIITEKRQKC